MRPRLALLAALLICWLTLPYAPAHAADGERIREQQVTYTLHRDGSLSVVEVFDYDFGSNQRHGMQREYRMAQLWTEGSGAWRILKVEGLTVRMDDRLWPPYSTQSDGETLRVRVGDPNAFITGVHRFTFAYTVKGAVVQRDGKVQWRWNLRRNDQTPVDRLSVTVNAPAPAQNGKCFRQPAGGTDASCGTFSGSPMTVQVSELAAGEDLNLWADYDPAAFDNPQPVVQQGWRRSSSSFSTSGVPNAVGGATEVMAWPLVALTALAAGCGIVRTRARRGAQQYAATPPGILPDNPEQAPLEPAQERVVPVRFDPPDRDGVDLPPALVGALSDNGTVNDDRVVASTIMDIVVKDKALMGNDQGRPTLTIPNGSTDGLDPYSTAAMKALLDGTQTYGPHYTDDLPNLDGASSDVMDLLYDDLRPTYVKRPRLDLGFLGPGIALTGAIVALAAFIISLIIGGEGHLMAPAWWPRWGFVALPLAAIGLIVMFVAALWTRREHTPLGRALWEQAQGFRQYIETAEADQLRFEEAEARFTRYLPYATAYGLTKRWVEEFGKSITSHWDRTGSGPAWYGADGYALHQWSSSGSTFDAYHDPSESVSGGSSSGDSSWSSSSSDSGSSSSSSDFGSSSSSW